LASVWCIAVCAIQNRYLPSSPIEGPTTAEHTGVRWGGRHACLHLAREPLRTTRPAGAKPCRGQKFRRWPMQALATFDQARGSCANAAPVPIVYERGACRAANSPPNPNL
jgi:hypothetical protein